MHRKQYTVFFSILLVTNQSWIIFNTARESLTALLYILWVFYLSGQCTIKKIYEETNMSHVSWVLYWSGIESNTKNI